MPKKYNLKINEELTRIFEIYIKIDPLKRYATLSQYLNAIIYGKANEILETLRSELKNENKELEKILEIKEYEGVLKALNSNMKY